MCKSIKIVSDGTINGTKIYNHDGTPLKYVQKCTINLGVDDGFVTAQLTFACPVLELSGVDINSQSRPLKPVYEIGSEGEPVGFVPGEE